MSLSSVDVFAVVLLVGATACGGYAPSTPPNSGRAVHLVGRFDASDPAGPRWSFPGSQIVVHFEGDALAVRLVEAQPNYYSVRIDGAERPVLETRAGEAAYELASGLPAGVHELVLTRRTEGFFGITQLLGFEGARLVESQPPYRRFIEYVGDSITCGYGVLGDGPECPFTGANESEPHAYGALAAAALGAGHAAIAYSGKGLYRNYGNEVTALMPEVYGRTFADRPAPLWGHGSGYRPDVIVVNLGTNDYWDGDPGDGFSAAYDAFVQELRRQHHEAWIVVVLSPMLSDAFPEGANARSRARERLQALVAGAAARGDARVRFVELDPQLEADGLGCDYHPGRVTHEKMAAKLVAELRALTGWTP